MTPMSALAATVAATSRPASWTSSGPSAWAAPPVRTSGTHTATRSTGGAAHALGPLDVHDAGLEVAATVAAKALIGVTAAVLLGAVTAFPALLGGLEALRMPRVLVLIAGMMYRYLFVILGEAERTRAALAARAYRPRNAVHAGALGRVAGTLFLRSYGRGERVHLAMLARGYDGHMPRAAPLALGRADVAFVALVLLALVPLRLLAGAGP